MKTNSIWIAKWEKAKADCRDATSALHASLGKIDPEMDFIGGIIPYADFADLADLADICEIGLGEVFTGGAVLMPNGNIVWPGDKDGNRCGCWQKRGISATYLFMLTKGTQEEVDIFLFKNN